MRPERYGKFSIAFRAMRIGLVVDQHSDDVGLQQVIGAAKDAGAIGHDQDASQRRFRKTQLAHLLLEDATDTIQRFKGQASAALVITEVDFAEFDSIETGMLFVALPRGQIRVKLVSSRRVDAAIAATLEQNK